MKRKMKEFLQDALICVFLLVLCIAALLYINDGNESNTRQYYQDAETMEYCPVELEE